MKIIKTASGNKIKLSKKEWEGIGKTAGWMKDLKKHVPYTKEFYIGELLQFYRDCNKCGNSLAREHLETFYNKENLKQIFDFLIKVENQYKSSESTNKEETYDEYVSKIVHIFRNQYDRDKGNLPLHIGLSQGTFTGKVIKGLEGELVAVFTSPQMGQPFMMSRQELLEEGFKEEIKRSKNSKFDPYDDEQFLQYGLALKAIDDEKATDKKTYEEEQSSSPKPPNMPPIPSNKEEGTRNRLMEERDRLIKEKKGETNISNRNSWYKKGQNNETY